MVTRDLSGTTADVAERYGVTTRTARAWRRAAGVASPGGRPSRGGLRVRIDPALIARVDAIAEAEGVTRTAVVERALRAEMGAL